MEEAVFQDEISLCILAGYSVRAMQPADAYELAGKIINDRELQNRAHSYFVPFPQDITDAIGGQNVSDVLRNKDIPEDN